LTVWHNPVAAYDRIAPIYASLADQRRKYLNAIERLVAAAIPPDSRTLLDVGAGDGSRARRIAQQCSISEIVLLEPAERMRSGGSGDAEFLTMRAEELHQVQTRFDVILCLWNVLGHIFPPAGRIEVLRQFARLLAPGGKAFIDVNHRYNARHYGGLPTSLRFLRDQFSWSEENGDVQVYWTVNGERCTTMGHVFTPKEMESLSRAAGLNIQKRFVVDYATGQERRRALEGHLLYVLTA
jgi:2-polyprenyl-3-methyl-5-hydroxy-6-metoxy-1,4-benzoquinol methylase